MEEAAKLAAKAGEDKLAAFKKSGDAAGFAAAKLVSRSKPEGINGLAMQEIMKADTTKLPATWAWMCRAWVMACTASASAAACRAG
jgi:peptidyl-prolyl cis-trans isomerase D